MGHRMGKRQTHASKSASANHGRKAALKKKSSGKFSPKESADYGSNLPPYMIEKDGLLIHCGVRVGEPIDTVEEIRRLREERAEQIYYGDRGNPQ